ncbi:serine hydrolase [Oenococcus sicerae]|uniref:Serine hydrolase n=1 Tax=Oenococcus sicerae TaxID=2203724 RepID=A0AAJ1VML9_9LACO|nr:serine hydrolase [Oenococcus sicerae]MDN6899796.1 serine hydrolase [Oenococcus sicerae]QAS70484.1 serine hydrolase [Oenococcus sicerae]
MVVTFSEMSQKIKAVLDPFDARIDFAFYLSTNDNQFILHGDQTMPSASVIKLMIADYYCSNFSIDELKNTKYEIRETVFGAGITPILDEKRFSLADLIMMMLALSDNTASNQLIDFIGIEKLSQWISRHYPSTRLSRKFMDFTNPKDNQTTVYDLAAALTNLMAFPLAKKALFNQQSLDKFEISFAESGEEKVDFFNKTGEGIGIDHDAILFDEKNQKTIAVLLTKYDPKIVSRIEIVDLFSKIGALIWDNFHD